MFQLHYVLWAVLRVNKSFTYIKNDSEINHRSDAHEKPVKTFRLGLFLEVILYIE